MKEVFVAFVRLGVTSFGGPIAHLAYFRQEFVERRGWLSDERYAELVALGQFLPGPASSQVGFALGYLRAGWRGALAAWFGFTMPSAVLMVAFAYGVATAPAQGPVAAAFNGAVHALMLVAVAVVAQALGAMARSLTPDLPRIVIALAAGTAVLVLGNPMTQIAVIAVGAGIGGFTLSTPATQLPTVNQSGKVAAKGRTPVLLLGALGTVLIALPLASYVTAAPANSPLAIADAYSRAGALVFGGGHVVLPLLEQVTVGQGVASGEQFLAGYGASQAMPGPLFTFAAYLGALAQPGLAGLGTAAVALVAIFVPGLMLMAAALPLWQRIRSRPRARGAIAGANAAVVGVLGAALINPVIVHAVSSLADAVVAIALLLALLLRVPVLWLVLAATALGAGLGVLVPPL